MYNKYINSTLYKAVFSGWGGVGFFFWGGGWEGWSSISIFTDGKLQTTTLSTAEKTQKNWE